MAQQAQRITGPDLRQVVAEIASDAYQGRAPGTPGDRMTRSYLSGRLRDAGHMPRPVRLGALVRWRRDILDQWIASGCPRDDWARKGG